MFWRDFLLHMSKKLFFLLIVPTLAWIKRRIVQATILRERADAVTAGVLSKEALFSLFAPILTSISRS